MAAKQKDAIKSVQQYQGHQDDKLSHSMIINSQQREKRKEVSFIVCDSMSRINQTGEARKKAKKKKKKRVNNNGQPYEGS